MVRVSCDHTHPSYNKVRDSHRSVCGESLLMDDTFSAFRLKYWIEIFDFVLLSVEFAGDLQLLLVILITYRSLSAWFILKVSVYPQNLSPWSNGSIIIFSLCVVVEIVALGIFWILRLSSIVKSKGRCLFTAFDLLSGCESSEHGSRYTVALGRKLWGQSTTDR